MTNFTNFKQRLKTLSSPTDVSYVQPQIKRLGASFSACLFVRKDVPRLFVRTLNSRGMRLFRNTTRPDCAIHFRVGAEMHAEEEDPRGYGRRNMRTAKASLLAGG